MIRRFSGLPTRVSCSWIMLAAAALLCGCGEEGLKLAPVEGTVLLDGAPVAEAGIMFQPADPKAGPPAVGTTDAEGKFALITANKPGALVGEHRVAISKS